MLEQLQLQVCKQWIDLAKKDIKQIKRHKKPTHNDWYTVGRIEVELMTMSDWASDILTDIEKRNTVATEGKTDG